ncbi:MAG: hypothetical protein J0L64_12225 [Acidobacteria bacterium]|nr:hypothetical protein [Acidobacteriota bacterium]
MKHSLPLFLLATAPLAPQVSIQGSLRGRITHTLPGSNSRRIQLGLKFIF